MKKTVAGTLLATVPKNQTTLGQFWSSNGSKPSSSNKPIVKIEPSLGEDDDIELLAAVEQFEKSNALASSTTTSKSTVKWPITYQQNPLVKQDKQQTHQASISAPDNDDEITHSYTDFDTQSGRIWIYPTNYEKRDYQFQIVSAALFTNTLVVLPTGLGKTFIAAVVMYNFCRWYPTGKIIFTAPTKPLVAQQMDACAKAMGIRRNEMCEMTGSVSPEERKRLWLGKRVFFMTPQTLNNDLVKSTCPWAKIRCLIIDEAHRALGQHAYCQVVQELCKNGEDFRILGLSATPGNNIEAVQNVINNLRISRIEMFTDDSPDIKKYSFDKTIDKIVVTPNQFMQDVRKCILTILTPPVETLSALKLLYQKNPAHITCGQIVMLMQRINKDKPTHLNDKQYYEAKNAIYFGISFFYALETLDKHGLQAMYNFFKKKLTEDPKKNLLLRLTFRNNSELNQIYQQLQNAFDLSLVNTQQRRTTSLILAHPKLAKLRECVIEHFQTFERTKTKATDQTRVIIFSEKRDSVREITELLAEDKPLVKPMAFIGQATSTGAGQGINQKVQRKVVSDFRAGGYNVLVATSIGEEGLDIGSVDLIICFDALKSPIRLVQRMGRTGRARQGRIVMLMTEGSEEHTFHSGEAQQKRLFKSIIDGARMLELYRHSRRMVPHGINPVCQEMTVKVDDDTADTSESIGKSSRKKTTKLSEFDSMLNKTKQQETVLRLFRKEKLLSDNEFYHWIRNYQLTENDNEPVMSSKDRLTSMLRSAIKKWSNHQRSLQSTTMHSSRTKIFVDIITTHTEENTFADENNHQFDVSPPIDENNESTVPIISPSVLDRPTMPLPFDRSNLFEQIKSKRSCSPLDLVQMPMECDRLLNLSSIQQQPSKRTTDDNEIDCGDLFGTGSTFDLTIAQPSVQEDTIGNFDITLEDLFPSSQTSRLSPTLQLLDTKSQQQQQESVFDDDEMDDDELLQAFNQHIVSSSHPVTNPSPVLMLTNRVATQNPSLADISLPKFDLEFSFDDLDNNNNNVLETSSISDNTSDTTTPIRPVQPKKRVRYLSAITPDVMQHKKKSKSAQELGDQSRHFHKRLASDFLDREATVDNDSRHQTVSISSDEDDHEDHNTSFIDDRQVFTQAANVDMTSVYLKSIKSPHVSSHRIRSSSSADIPIDQLYSQLPTMTMIDDDTYDDHDGFIVDDTTQIVDDHQGEVDFDELINILGTQSAIHRESKVTRRGVKFGRTTTPKRRPQRRVLIAQSPV